MRFRATHDGPVGSGSDEDDELASLVSPAANGDQRAMQRIIAIIHPRVLRYARARMSGGRMPTPEDVSQEICLAVASALPRYHDTGKPFMAFVYGIAYNKVADAHRAYSRDKTHPTEELPDREYAGVTPEEAALTIEGSNAVRALLDVLSDTARDIIILRVFVGLTAEETAEAVGSTPGAVRVAQHRALAKLREELGQDDGRFLGTGLSRQPEGGQP